MSAPPRLYDMPISAPVWVWLIYAGIITYLGTTTGSIMGFLAVCFAAAFSFQFWTFACWRGLRRKETKT